MKRTLFLTAGAILAGLIVLAGLTGLGGAVAQIDPTAQQQTVDAAIAQRFGATATAEFTVGQTLTSVAVTRAGPTLTAEFDATLDAAFNQAVTGTAAAQATATEEALRRRWEPLMAALDGIAQQKALAVSDWFEQQQAALDELVPRALTMFTAGMTEFALPASPMTDLVMYDTDGQVVAVSETPMANSADVTPETLAAWIEGPHYEVANGAATVLLAVPVTSGTGEEHVATLVGRFALAPLDDLLAAPDSRVSIYLVTSAGACIFAPSGVPDVLTCDRDSEAISRGLRGEAGAGAYNDYRTPPVRVIGAYRWVGPALAAVVVEVTENDAAAVVAVLPSPTPQPTAGPLPTGTPRPAGFPTDVASQVQLAESVFEHGRMFWLRHNRQIWVMVNDPADNDTGGDWYCYNDSFAEGEPETDPALVPPEGLIQPRRGFGKLWRTHEELKDALGWAITPEFELTSTYTYIAGGYLQDGVYVPGPGEHRLNTLYGEVISFFERELRGDCLGGTWRKAVATG